MRNSLFAFILYKIICHWAGVQATSSDDIVQVREVFRHDLPSNRSQEALPAELKVSFHVKHTEVVLLLTRNDHIDVDVPITYAEDDDVEKPAKSSQVENFALYQDIHNGAAMSIRVVDGGLQADRKLEGTFLLKGHVYGIEAVSKGQREQRRNFAPLGGYYHRIYEVKDKRTNIHGMPDFGDQIWPKLQARSRREMDTSGDTNDTVFASKPVYHYVELMFVLDHTLWAFYAEMFKQDTEQRLRHHFAQLMNGVDMTYKSIGPPWSIRIRPRLMRIYVCKTPKEAPWTYKGRYSTNKKFVNIAFAVRKLGTDSRFRKYHIDHLVLFTRYDISFSAKLSEHKVVVGATSMWGICLKSYSATIIEDIGVLSWEVLAHELGHNLGSRHDSEKNDCSSSKHNIMAPTIGHADPDMLPNRYKFSDCSVRAIIDTLKGWEPSRYPHFRRPRKCLLNKVCRHGVNMDNVLMAGQVYSLDMQCQLHFGPLSKSAMTEDICKTLKCMIPSTGRYKHMMPGAAEGTKCAKDKCCRRSQCVADCSNPPTDQGPCDVNTDGGWGRWSAYGSCSHTCGAGTRQRSRHCDNPKRSGEGDYCMGDDTSTASCRESNCLTLHSGSMWSPWTEYAGCSKTCNYGVVTRTRTCFRSRDSVRTCPGRSVQYRVCMLMKCPTVGSWGPWSEFGPCSKSCGYGSKSRNRTCARGRSGKHCIGAGISYIQCRLMDCPRENTEWGSWSQYGPCSQTCGLGRRSRTRSCPDEKCTGRHVEYDECTLEECPPVADGWSQWSEYSNCSVTCGYGKKVKTRTCQGLVDCIGRHESYQQCHMLECLPPMGQWGNWSAYGACSQTCGPGIRSRKRTCTRLEQEADCEGGRIGHQKCNLRDCASEDMGKWGEWSPFSDCSVSCGDGRQVRYRECATEGDGENGCDGELSNYKSCVMPACQNCTDSTTWKGRWFIKGTAVTCSSIFMYGHKGACQFPEVRQQCCSTCARNNNGERPDGCTDEDDWKARWSSSSKILTCQSIRLADHLACRAPLAKTKCCAACWGPGKDSIVKDDTSIWSEWSSFSDCSVTCGVGKQVRHRRCATTDGEDRTDCQGETSDYRSCVMPLCEGCTDNLMWKAIWRIKGTEIRCSNILYSQGACQFPEVRQQCCATCVRNSNGEKPEDCTDDDDWKARWSSSSKILTCQSIRLADHLACRASLARKQCCATCWGPGNDTLTKAAGGWGPWSVASACSKTCGYGRQSRTRACVRRSGEAMCVGQSMVYARCKIADCNIGSWSPWSQFSACSAKCGVGNQIRYRRCQDSQCDGESSSKKPCIVKICPGCTDNKDWRGVWKKRKTIVTCKDIPVHNQAACTFPEARENCCNACARSYNGEMPHDCRDNTHWLARFSKSRSLISCKLMQESGDITSCRLSVVNKQCCATCRINAGDVLETAECVDDPKWAAKWAGSTVIVTCESVRDRDSVACQYDIVKRSCCLTCQGVLARQGRGLNAKATYDDKAIIGDNHADVVNEIDDVSEVIWK